MRSSLCLPAVMILALVTASFAQDQTLKKEVPPGWPDVFPTLPMYQATFKKAEISEDKKAYRQTAAYEWTGGRLESNNVTLARGEQYIKDHTGAALLKNADPPELIKVGDYSGWLWKEKKKVVVMLGKDRILMVQAKFDGDLLNFTGRFPLKDCAKALDNPPRVEYSRKLDAFRELKKGMSYAAVTKLV